ncbi:MAG: glycosyltransferase [Chloroflexota bacterium]|nr:glycosyltransferase [Chloroflexota bacterium]
MKLLVMSPNFPRPTWGAGTRNYHLLKALASKHTVSLLALVDSAEMQDYDSSLLEEWARVVQVVVRPQPRSKRKQQVVASVRGQSYVLAVQTVARMQEALDALLARDRYDAVVFESALIAGYRLPAGLKVVIDQHNIEYELLQRTYKHEVAWLRRWYNWRESCLLKPIEIARCRRAQAVLVTSERERLSLQRVLADKLIEVVPNGVDIQAFQGESGVAAQEIAGRLVFTGTMDYYPNVDAVLSFARQCWPLIQAQYPEATWYIVGKNPLPDVRKLGDIPGITVTGFVADVRPYLASASVAIAPLSVGSGTRLKLLEAFAMRKAVVSTSLGCEGLAVRSGTHLLVEDQPEAFAHAVLAFLRNPEKRRLFGSAGRALVEEQYSWERCGARLLHVLDEIA